MKITIVGLGIMADVESIMKACGISLINEVNTGMLGNFNTLTYVADIPEEEVISTRKKLMNCLVEEGLIALYEHGNWMHVYVFKKSAFK